MSVSNPGEEKFAYSTVGKEFDDVRDGIVRQQHERDNPGDELEKPVAIESGYYKNILTGEQRRNINREAMNTADLIRAQEESDLEFHLQQLAFNMALAGPFGNKGIITRTERGIGIGWDGEFTDQKELETRSFIESQVVGDSSNPWWREMVDKLVHNNRNRGLGINAEASKLLSSLNKVNLDLENLYQSVFALKNRYLFAEGLDPELWARAKEHITAWSRICVPSKVLDEPTLQRKLYGLLKLNRIKQIPISILDDAFDGFDNSNQDSLRRISPEYITLNIGRLLKESPPFSLKDVYLLAMVMGISTDALTHTIRVSDINGLFSASQQVFMDAIDLAKKEYIQIHKIPEDVNQ